MALKSNKEDFITKSIKLYGNKYDYSLVEYINSKVKVKIICSIHGIFEQRPNDHLTNHGCSKCTNCFLDKEYFIQKANIIHNNKYDYSLVDYNNSQTKVKIICPEHGLFEQMPYSHLQKHGCKICNVSKGELTIEKWLQKHSIEYETQKRFRDCRNKQPLPFDFYLPQHNCCIEFDGEQHFAPMRHSNNKAKNLIKFQRTQLHDKIKNEYCHLNNIKLIRISYNETIENILKEHI